MSLPSVAILGYGRAGKDTAGMWLHLHTPLRYSGSTSMAVCPLIAKDLQLPVEEAWSTRHKNRMFWWQWANNYRKDDASKLAQYSLSKGNLVVGLRDTVELNACLDKKLFDLTVWIENPDSPNDPTVTFKREDCDVVVDNVKDKPDQFFRRLANLASYAKIPVYKCSNCDDPLKCRKALSELVTWDDVQSFLSTNKS